jgi:hypothetical protein
MTKIEDANFSAFTVQMLSVCRVLIVMTIGRIISTFQRTLRYTRLMYKEESVRLY